MLPPDLRFDGELRSNTASGNLLERLDRLDPERACHDQRHDVSALHPRTPLVSHPEAGDAEADDSADAEREDRREAAVEIGDARARIASEEDPVGHHGYEHPGD